MRRAVPVWRLRRGLCGPGPIWMFLVPSTRGVYPRISFLYSLADKTRTILHPQSGSTVYSLLAGTHPYARHELRITPFGSTLVVEVNEIPSRS